MLKLLLKKEWLENFRFSFKKNVKNPLSSIINGVIMISLVACLLYVFVLLNKRFVYYDVSLPLYTIAIFLFVVIQMIIHLGKFSKMVFNSSDKQIVNALPIPKRTLVFSKLIIFYLEELFSLMVLTVPLTIAYGITNYGFAFNSFYFVLIPIVFVLPLVVVMLSLLFAYPYHYMYKFLRGKHLLQFVLILVMISSFAFFYRSLLDVFIALVNEDRLSYIFNTDNAKLLENISKYLIPVNFITGLLENPLVNILYLLLTCLISFAVCYLLSNYLYSINVRAKEFRLKSKKNNVLSMNKTLIKKEYLLMFRSSNYLFSYGSLLVLLPVFVSIVTLSIRPLVIRLIGENLFIPFVILFVSMFACVVNSFGGLVVSREKGSICILKMIPVSYEKQMNVKVMISVVNAAISLLATCICLIALKITSVIDGVFIFMLSLILVVFLIISIASNDLKKPAFKNEENNLSIAIIFSIIIPIVLFLLSILLILNLDVTMMFFILIVALFALLFVSYIRYNNSINKNFRKLKVE